MGNLSSAEQIWVIEPTEDELIKGARYASMTLPWTFNRMMLNTGSSGQQRRALNIAKGVVGQLMIQRALNDRGVSAQAQTKSYRDEDLFDLEVPVDGTTVRFDFKSIHYFKDYTVEGRAPLTSDLIIEHAEYPGPSWPRFFPMLIPHTQIRQDKEAYMFALAESIDPRRDIDTDRLSYAITAFPYGETLPFFSYKKLCLAREAAGQGFYLSLNYRPGSMLDGGELEVRLNGEWDGQAQLLDVVIPEPGVERIAGPFSCLASVGISREALEYFSGRLEIGVARNEFVTPLLNTARRNVNTPPNQLLRLVKSDFVNLILPSHYKLYVVGWTTKEDFLENCTHYQAWIWPKDSVDRFKNQPWAQFTEKDKNAIRNAGFSDAMQSNPSRLAAGWMKTTGRGGGACCYVFPNIGHNGGVKEHNLFVLPSDLRPLDDLIP